MITKILIGMTVILSVHSFLVSLSIEVLCLHLLKNGMSKPTKQEINAYLGEIGRRRVKRLKKHFGIDIDTVCEELVDQIDHL